MCTSDGLLKSHVMLIKSCTEIICTLFVEIIVHFLLDLNTRIIAEVRLAGDADRPASSSLCVGACSCCCNLNIVARGQASVHRDHPYIQPHTMSGVSRRRLENSLRTTSC